MILKALVVAGILSVAPSMASMSFDDFSKYIEPLCFHNDQEFGTLRVNGQENPLASTLDNFIALAEKFEASNPNIGLKDEVFYFLRNFTYDNLKFTPNGELATWRPAEVEVADVETLWEPDENARTRVPTGEDPFSEDEKCSLFFMLSHTVIDTPKVVTQQRSYVNISGDGTFRSNFNPEELYPQEQGVVAIRGTDAAISLGRVLRGLYVGLNENRKRGPESFPKIQKAQVNLPPNTMVDPLYIVTLGDVLILSQWSYETRIGLAPNGEWKSVPLSSGTDIKDVCPMVHKLDDPVPAYSYASVRGGADGLIMGEVIAALLRKKNDIQLSQVLRMYYGRNGITEQMEDLGTATASICRRETNMLALEQKLSDQMLFYGLLASSTDKKVEKTRDDAFKFYNNEKRKIYENYNTELKKYCDEKITIENTDNWPLETPLDVIIVLDTANGPEYFEKQQLIVGHFAKHMELRYAGSRLTVLTDIRIAPSASTSGVIQLKSIIDDTYSSSCAACVVTQSGYEQGSSAPREIVVLGIDQLLQTMKENQTKYNGVNGKVVVFFNFDDEDLPGSANSKNTARINKALRDLHMRHQDVLFYALGRKDEVLKKYARADEAFIMSATNQPESTSGKILFQKISGAPAIFQYPDCIEAKSEGSAIFENFISPSTVQHWEMPSEYFYKSYGLKVIFESQYGPIRVCYNRATISPEIQAKSCLDTLTNNRIEFKDSNPCKSLPKESCAPFYFAILGLNSTGDIRNYCMNTNDAKCRTADQIKFKVSHEGIRCSGSLGLIATPLVLLFAVLMSHMCSKTF